MNNTELLRKFQVDIAQQEVQDEVRRKLLKVPKESLPKGFRIPQQMPARYIMKQFGDDFLHGIMQELLTQHVNARIWAEKWDVAGTTINCAWDRNDKPLRYLYDVVLELYPNFELKGLEALQLRTPGRTVVDDSHINGALEVLRRSNSAWRKVDRPSAPGDRVTINFSSVLADGSTFPGGSAENVGIELGAGGMLPEFEQQLTGVRAAQALDFPVAFPDDYTTPVLKGNTAFFSVLVLSVSEFDLIPIDDAFAAKVGVEGGMPELREKTRIHLQQQHDEQDQRDADSDLLRQLAMANICALPQMLVHEQLFVLQNEAAFSRGVSIEEVQSDESLLEQAQYRVHLGVVVRQLVKQEKIAIAPNRDLTEQILEWLKARAAQNAATPP